jgi:hypothetical protein
MNIGLVFFIGIVASCLDTNSIFANQPLFFRQKCGEFAKQTNQQSISLIVDGQGSTNCMEISKSNNQGVIYLYGNGLNGEHTLVFNKDDRVTLSRLMVRLHGVVSTKFAEDIVVIHRASDNSQIISFPCSLNDALNSIDSKLDPVLKDGDRIEFRAIQLVP